MAAPKPPKPRGVAKDQAAADRALARQMAHDQKAINKERNDYAASRKRAYATSKVGPPKPRIGGNTRNLKT